MNINEKYLELEFQRLKNEFEIMISHNKEMEKRIKNYRLAINKLEKEMKK